MLNRKWLWGVPVGALLIFSLAQAQDAQPGQGRNRQRGGNFDPAQFREQRMNDLKERLGATDDEWKVLQPKVTKVMDAQRESFAMGGGRFGGGRGGQRGGNDRGGDQANRPGGGQETKLQKAQGELRTTLENKSAANADVQAKLKAYREARDKARTDLQAAQKELKEVCSVRQEATLVMAGMLE
jgi:hypothetical protein